MDIVMIRKTLWNGSVLPIGEELTVSDAVGNFQIKRGCAETKEANLARKAKAKEHVHMKHVKKGKEPEKSG